MRAATASRQGVRLRRRDVRHHRRSSSSVIAYDRATGAQTGRFDTKGENLLAEHGSSSIAFDAAERIVMTNHAPVTGLVAKKFSIVDSTLPTTAGR